MRETRYPTEVITDKALLLVLMHLTANNNKNILIGDRLKCMKLPFFAANTMFQDREKGFNLRFFRDKRGPLSKDVYSAWNHFLVLGLLTENTQGFEITPKGDALAQVILNNILSNEHNAEFKDILSSVALKYGKLTSKRIMQIVYDMEISLPCTDGRAKIRDIALGEDMIMVLDNDEARSILEVEPAWLETLTIELSPINAQGLTNAFCDFAKGHVLTHEEVWQNVSG